MKKSSLADTVADKSGSWSFLLGNAVLFALWIAINTMSPRRLQFDPYPYQFLTMTVSLEAIILSVLVLISQNRQSAIDRQKVELDLESDLRSEQLLRDLQRQVTRIEHAIIIGTHSASQLMKGSSIHVVDAKGQCCAALISEVVDVDQQMVSAHLCRPPGDQVPARNRIMARWHGLSHSLKGSARTWHYLDECMEGGHDED